jgi:hypothetical protein
MQRGVHLIHKGVEFSAGLCECADKNSEVTFADFVDTNNRQRFCYRRVFR